MQLLAGDILVSDSCCVCSDGAGKLPAVQDAVPRELRTENEKQESIGCAF